jgi:hypothetical protein
MNIWAIHKIIKKLSVQPKINYQCKKCYAENTTHPFEASPVCGGCGTKNSPIDVVNWLLVHAETRLDFEKRKKEKGSKTQKPPNRDEYIQNENKALQIFYELLQQDKRRQD